MNVFAVCEFCCCSLLRQRLPFTPALVLSLSLPCIMPAAAARRVCAFATRLRVARLCASLFLAFAVGPTPSLGVSFTELHVTYMHRTSSVAAQQRGVPSASSWHHLHILLSVQDSKLSPVTAQAPFPHSLQRLQYTQPSVCLERVNKILIPNGTILSLSKNTAGKLSTTCRLLAPHWQVPVLRPESDTPSPLVTSAQGTGLMTFSSPFQRARDLRCGLLTALTATCSRAAVVLACMCAPLLHSLSTTLEFKHLMHTYKSTNFGIGCGSGAECIHCLRA